MMKNKKNKKNRKDKKNIFKKIEIFLPVVILINGIFDILKKFKDIFF